MNIFQKAIDDIFSVPEFQVFFKTSSGEEITAIVYETSTAEAYTEFGIDSGVSFYLSCKVKDFTPRKGEKIFYRGKQYRIEEFEEDSFGLTYKIFLKDLTSK